MSSTNKKKSKTESERLREFALVMCVALVLVTGLLFWKASWISLITSGIAAVILLFGVFAPLKLSRFEKRWMQLAEKMSIVVSFIIVTLTFYLMITPMGVLMRLFGADLLRLKIDKERESYWDVCETDGPATRPYTPY